MKNRKNHSFFNITLLLIFMFSFLVSCQPSHQEQNEHKSDTISDTNGQSDFFVYYTKINSGESFEKHSRTGDYADLVVQLEKGQVVFHRSSSYLPYWQTDSGKWYFEELIPRSGDGPDVRPDKNNLYSFVRLIQANKDSITIHWRYFPDFELGSHAQPTGGNVEFDGVVHEYFTFYPDGKVRRVIRNGTKKLDDWNDPLNKTVQRLELTSDGITVNKTKAAKLSRKPVDEISGAPVLQLEEGADLLAAWHFDEGLTTREYNEKDLTYESVSEQACPVTGPKTVWKKGVSGTALAFDGYNTKVSIEPVELPEFGEDGGLSVETWVAPGAYSICSWTAIAHQSEWEADIRENIFQMRNWGEMQLGEKLKKGYFLGIDEYGRPVVILATETEVVHITSPKSIPLYEWSHVAFTYVDEGMLYLYVNGKLVDFSNFSGHLVPSENEFMIGMNDQSIGYVSQHVVRTYSTFPSQLGFEGLIDEVKVYAEPLWDEMMNESYQLSRPEELAADMQARKLPGVTGPSDKFGAAYTKLDYHDLWDNMWREPDHPDIVVKFDMMPTSVVFWRGCRSPGWVTETNKWISDQSSELTDWHWNNVSEGAQSCCEHMSDYQARHSHVRIIENTDARVVIHWRYASVDVLYKHPNTCKNEDDWGEWTDEYLTIYPDGAGVRYVDQHGGMDFYYDEEGLGIGFHDTQFLSEAGTKPEDNINPQSMTIISHQDETSELDWSQAIPEGEFDAQVIWVNLKSEYKVFEIFPPETNINVWSGGENTGYSKYPAWNHYPVTQAPCDGRFCVAPDRLAHSALGAADNLTETGNMLIYGFTNNKAESLIPLARSWNNAPKIIKPKDCKVHGYNKSQKAYILQAEKEKISFTVKASMTAPVVNPCFVIKGFKSKADISLDGKKTNIRQGIVRNTNGERQLIIWMEYESKKPVHITISKI